MSMYNSKDSVENFARSCFNIALSQGMPLYFSSKSGALNAYDGMFVNVFETMYDDSYKEAFEGAGLWYQHVLTDEMVSQVIKSKGGFVWACKNYDGDVQSDIIAYGSAP